MPTHFPTMDNDTGELVDVTYYYASEAATRLHVTVRTLQRRCQQGRWPHLKVSGTYYFSAAHIAAIVRIQTLDVHQVNGHTTGAQPPSPPRLGVVMDNDELDGLGGVR